LQTHIPSWNEPEFGHESQRGPKSRTTLLTKPAAIFWTGVCVCCRQICRNPRVVRQRTLAMSPSGLGSKNDCAGLCCVCVCVCALSSYPPADWVTRSSQQPSSHRRGGTVSENTRSLGMKINMALTADGTRNQDLLCL
jgi:hypothetical protein